MNSELPAVVDALVVGGGPSGLAAATWLGRYQRFTLVVDAGENRNRSADHVHGLLGRDPIAPKELLADARAGLEQYPLIQTHHGVVSKVRRSGDGLFHARVDDTHQVTASRLVLATGIRDQAPQILGFEGHYGTDVHHCPSCDGFMARNEDIIVLGSSRLIPGFAAGLLDWARSVKIITHSRERIFTTTQRGLLHEHRIPVVRGTAESFVGEPGRLSGVRMSDGTLVEGTRVFFSFRHLPTNHLAMDLGCELNHDGSIVVDKHQMTSVDGVYAAGDIAASMRLIPVAISGGTIAGIACATSLRGHETTPQAPDPAPPTRWFT
jgi:thioredoxin reductase